jgi:hypothetical protein
VAGLAQPELTSGLELLPVPVDQCSPHQLWARAVIGERSVSTRIPSALMSRITFRLPYETDAHSPASRRHGACDYVL